MRRRANRSGTLFRRGTVWYTKIKVNGAWSVKSTGTSNRAAATRILDTISRGYELTDEERIAAILVRLQHKDVSLTFSAAWDKYTSAPENIDQPPGQQRSDNRTFMRFVEWVGNVRRSIKTIDAVDIETVTQYVASLKKENAASSVNMAIRSLRRIWKLCHVDPNPWSGFRKIAENRHLRRALTHDEVELCITSASGEMRKLFALGAYTGLRMRDCSRIRWEDFDPVAGTLNVKPSKTKHSSGVTVSIPVHPSLARIIGERQASGYVMPELATGTRNKLVDRIRKHFRSCGFEEPERIEGYKRSMPVVGFHSFRSTFITNMANIGAPLSMVQAIVGHVSPEMTQRYYRADPEAARERVAALPGYGIV